MKCTCSHTRINYFHFNHRHKVFPFLSKAIALPWTLDSTFFSQVRSLLLPWTTPSPSLLPISLVLEQVFATEMLSRFLNLGGRGDGKSLFSFRSLSRGVVAIPKESPQIFYSTSKLTMSFCSLIRITQNILCYTFVFFTDSVRAMTTHVYILSTKLKAWQKGDLLFILPEFSKNSKHVKVLVTPQT